MTKINNTIKSQLNNKKVINLHDVTTDNKLIQSMQELNCLYNTGLSNSKQKELNNHIVASAKFNQSDNKKALEWYSNNNYKPIDNRLYVADKPQLPTNDDIINLSKIEYNHIFDNIKITGNTTFKPVKVKPFKAVINNKPVNIVKSSKKARKRFKPVIIEYYCMPIKKTIVFDYPYEIIKLSVIPSIIDLYKSIVIAPVMLKNNLPCPIVTYDLLNDYLLNRYEGLTKNIINKMFSFVKVHTDENGKTSISYDHCHKACYEIIKKGYNDIIFEDLKQECFMYLFENKERIVINGNNTKYFIDINDLYIELYKVIRAYLYNNKQKQSNKNVALEIETTNDENDKEILVITDKTGLYYTIDSKSYNNVEKRINQILSYCEITYTDKVYKNIVAVMPYLIKGYKHKDISNMLNVSLSVVKKYSMLIKQHYNEIVLAENKQLNHKHNMSMLNSMYGYTHKEYNGVWYTVTPTITGHTDINDTKSNNKLYPMDHKPINYNTGLCGIYNDVTRINCNMVVDKSLPKYSTTQAYKDYIKSLNNKPVKKPVEPVKKPVEPVKIKVCKMPSIISVNDEISHLKAIQTATNK